MTVAGLLERVRRNPLLALPSALAVALYARGALNGFAFDDSIDLLQNRFVTGRFDIAGIFTSEYFGGYGHLASGHYRPLLNLTYKLIEVLFGLRPAAYHILSLLAFAAIVALTVALVQRLSGRDLAGILAGALVAVHPLNSEAVAAIVGLKELGALGFGLVALWMALARGGPEGDPPPSRGWDRPAAVFALLLAGLLYKETALAFALLTAASGLFLRPTRPGLESRWRAAAPAVLAVAAWAGLRLAVTGGLFSPSGVFTIDNPLASLAQPARFFSALSLLPRYLGLWVWPACLVNDYSQGSFPLPASPALVLLSVVLLTGFGALFVWAVSSGRNAVAFGLAAFFLSWLLISNLFVTIGTSMAERLFFAPGWGLAVALAALVAEGLERAAIRRPAARRLAVGAIVAVLAALSVRTIARAGDWKDDTALWSSAAACNPTSLKVLLSRAETAAASNHPDEARRHFEEALRVAPGSPYVAGSYGEFLLAQKDEARGEALLKTASEGPEAFNSAVLSLAFLYRNQGRTEEAVATATRLLSLSPSYRQAAAAYGIRAAAALAAGDPRTAEEEYRRSAAEDPTDSRPVYNMGLCREAQGDWEGALRAYVQAEELGTSEPRVVLSRSIAESALGRHEQALRTVERLLAGHPGLLPAREHWAGLMLLTGKVPEAVAEARRILQENPNDGAALMILARAAEASGDTAEARARYEAILEIPNLRPDMAEEMRRKIETLAEKRD